MRNLLHHVEADWDADADGPQARAALQRWAERHPDLGAFASPGDLVRRCHSRTDPAAVTAAEALVGEARSDPWAARTVLAVVLPGLGKLIRSNHDLIGEFREPFATLAELEQFVLCAAYERIAAGTSPSATRQLRAVLVATAERLRAHARAHHRECRRRVPLADTVADPLGAQRTDAEELTAVLVDAVRRQVLRVVDARLVYTTRVAGHSPAEVAAALSWQPASLRRRRHRVERALATELNGLPVPGHIVATAKVGT